MDSAFELFPAADRHDQRWQRARRITDGKCPGKDTLDQKCTCPDLMYATRIHILSGRTIHFRLYCGCCDLPLTDPLPWSGLAKGEATTSDETPAPDPSEHPASG